MKQFCACLLLFGWSLSCYGITKIGGGRVVGGGHKTGTPVAAYPTFSPSAGTYTTSKSVTLADSTPGAVIHYTVDGSTPTDLSPVYGSAITVASTTTIKALATATGYTQSSVSSATYTIIPLATPPLFAPGPGSFSSAQTVAISDSTPGATIHVTSDGTTPTELSPAYYGPIDVPSTMTIRAMATAGGYANSAVSGGTYTITIPSVATPTFTPVTGTYTSSQSVTIADTTPGASIYYTTDGSTPTTTGGLLYSGPITVSATQTLKAIAVATGYVQSAVGSATITITSAGANLLFASNFSGTTTLATPVCGSTYCDRSITGTDTTTGFTWPPNVNGSANNTYQHGEYVEMMPYGTYSAATIGTVQPTWISSAAGHEGTIKPILSLENDCYSASQNYSGIVCATPGTTGTNAWGQVPYEINPDVRATEKDVYIRSYVKLPATLATMLSPTTNPNGSWADWMVLSEWKTGGPLQGNPGTNCTSTYGGDLRIVNQIKVSAGVLYWHSIMDTNANGNVPEPPAGYFWQLDNRSVPVPVGQWFKLEWFWHRSAGSDGRVWMAVNGAVIYDRPGWNINTPNNGAAASGKPAGTTGYGYSCKIDRIVPFTVYTNLRSATPPSLQVDRIEIWDGMPSDSTLH